jgi:hypothetical protein
MKTSFIQVVSTLYTKSLAYLGRYLLTFPLEIGDKIKRKDPKKSPKMGTKARFTLGVRAGKTWGANFEHFGLVVWPQNFTNKC